MNILVTGAKDMVGAHRLRVKVYFLSAFESNQ